MCQCIVLGLAPASGNESINSLIQYDPISAVLFDSAIIENLKPVFKEMYVDSVQRAIGSSEAAQGESVFNYCMRYYKSTQLENFARKELRKAREIGNLEEHISLKFPTF